MATSELLGAIAANRVSRNIVTAPLDEVRVFLAFPRDGDYARRQLAGASWSLEVGTLGWVVVSHLRNRLIAAAGRQEGRGHNNDPERTARKL